MACSVGALAVYDMVKGIEPGVVIERIELLDKTGGKSDFHRHESASSSTGTAATIGDVRISVTDRCNFRCQYCMPAEGLPWLDRDEHPHLRGDRAASSGCWRRWASTTCG